VAEHSLKLIVGLGNPGSDYARTRHNAGFWLVDALADKYRGSWRRQPRDHAEVARTVIEGRELWLLKPTTYMNLSGAPVQAVAHFHRFEPRDILVVHDDIDLPPGVVRLKEGGGHGGHNGLRDVMGHIGAGFMRLRIGVGHPGHRDLVIDAVLDRPTAEEAGLIEEAMARALEVVPVLIRDGAQRAMSVLHRRPEDAAPARE
jgi:PTH1 family peptidyl-tRNA hydrolase